MGNVFWFSCMMGAAGFGIQYSQPLQHFTSHLGILPGSPSDLNTGNRIEGATGCPSWCRPLRPLFHFLCSNLKANPVLLTELSFWCQQKLEINLTGHPVLGSRNPLYFASLCLFPRPESPTGCTCWRAWTRSTSSWSGRASTTWRTRTTRGSGHSSTAKGTDIGGSIQNDCQMNQ